MTAQHRGFAAAADGRGAELAAWQLPPAGLDIVGEYRELARHPWWCLADTIRRMAEPFMAALRGYDMAQVNAVLKQADEALASDSEALRATARGVLQDVQFRQRFRGYARHEVDRAIRQRLQQLT